jgi:hypothetical protein
VTGAKGESRPISRSLRLVAGNHDGAGPETHLPVDAQFMNFRTIKSVRDQRVFGVGDDSILLLRLSDTRSERRERAKACQRQQDAGEEYEQAN